LKAERGDSGCNLALEWGQGGETFNQSEFDALWRSLTQSGITLCEQQQTNWRLNRFLKKYRITECCCYTWPKNYGFSIKITGVQVSCRKKLETLYPGL
jgi:hypothetical protein